MRLACRESHRKRLPWSEQMPLTDDLCNGLRAQPVCERRRRVGGREEIGHDDKGNPIIRYFRACKMSRDNRIRQSLIDGGPALATMSP